MKHIHLIFTKDDKGDVTIDGAYTNGTKALERYEELRNNGYTANYEKIAVNEENVNVLLNVWTSKVKN